MFGIPKLEQAIKEGFESTAAILDLHTKAIVELSDMVERTSTTVKASAIDTNRRLAVIEGDAARFKGGVDILRDYEESHATYVNHSINGFEKRERIPHDCALCVAARKYL